MKSSLEMGEERKKEQKEDCVSEHNSVKYSK